MEYPFRSIRDELSDGVEYCESGQCLAYGRNLGLCNSGVIVGGIIVSDMRRRVLWLLAWFESFTEVEEESNLEHY